MNLIFEFLADPANWQGPGGIPARIWEHLLYTAVTLVIGVVKKSSSTRTSQA